MTSPSRILRDCEIFANHRFKIESPGAAQVLGAGSRQARCPCRSRKDCNLSQRKKLRKYHLINLVLG